jgi:hypothetical protein
LLLGTVVSWLVGAVVNFQAAILPVRSVKKKRATGVALIALSEIQD